MSPQHTPINPSSLKARFASKFLRALKNLKKNSHRSIPTTTSTPSTREIYRRSHRVKLAAYESMASAVGSRRAWSRATLQKAKNRARISRGLIRRKRITIFNSHALKRRRKIGRGRERNKNPNPKKDHIEDKFSAELRKLVPGGEGMDICKLLDETADYVKCLATQVEVMRKIVNFCSI